MPIDISAYHPILSQFLKDFLSEHRSIWKDERWGKDVADRLLAFAVSGKLIRGSLVLAAYQLSTHQDFKKALPLAAAVECMQSALLIHDDFIDQDLLRRGEPSVPAQYRTLAQKNKYPLIDHAGNSLAICAGDITFFLAFELMSQMEVSAETFSALIKRFAQEYQLVGLGEMDDVHLGFSPEKASLEEILAVYRSKTARYTLTLPMLMGGIAGDLSPHMLSQVDRISEVLGLIFQIKDDQLGIFGSEKEIGKPVTSDVREGKKTIFYYYGMSRAKGSDLALLKKAFGNAGLTVAQLEEVKKVLISSGAVSQVEGQVEKLRVAAVKAIRDVPDKDWQDFLTAFLNFNILRKR